MEEGLSEVYQIMGCTFFEGFDRIQQHLRNSPVQMVNRFTTLDSTISPRPTFQSALVNYFDPFEDIEPLKPFKIFPKTSPYYAKSPSHNLFIIESDFSHLKSPEAIAKAYFPFLWHFPAIHLEKSIKFYRDVLLQTKSIQINPIKCQRIRSNGKLL
jgi:hypothetical protein